ncbi:MAG TPA: hypothetical protein PKI59_03770, partial [Candidatus Cloacimonadota bacterium]|nr:hypothetical protein [Candidatus Cloacimonadota bacterium]
MPKAGLLIVGALVLMTALYADLTGEFTTKATAAADNAAQQALVTEYLPRMSSVEEHRSLQNVWLSLDREACLQYYKKLLAENPQEPKYKYLVLRTADQEDQLSGSRALIRQRPGFYWGYRVLAVRLVEDLIPHPQDSYIKSADFPADKAAIGAGLKLYPEDGYLNLCLFHMLRLEADNSGAEAALLKIQDPDIITNN